MISQRIMGQISNSPPTGQEIASHHRLHHISAPSEDTNGEPACSLSGIATSTIIHSRKTGCLRCSRSRVLSFILESA